MKKILRILVLIFIIIFITNLPHANKQDNWRINISHKKNKKEIIQKKSPSQIAQKKSTILGKLNRNNLLDIYRYPKSYLRRGASGEETSKDIDLYEYYDNSSEVDSINNWFKNHSVINKKMELENLFGAFGKYFYRLHDSILVNGLRTYLSIMDNDEKNIKVKGQVKQYLNANNQIYHHGELFEQIWDESELVIIPTIHNKDFLFPYDIEATKIEKEILKITTTTYDTLNRIYVLNSLDRIDSIKKSIFQIRAYDQKKCELYFYLWHRLYSLHRSDTIWSAYWNIHSIISNNKEMGQKEIAKWYIALAKMLISVDFKEFSPIAFNCLKSAQGALISDDDNGFYHKIQLFQIDIMRAFMWSTFPGLQSKQIAVKLMMKNFSLVYPMLTPFEKYKYYIYTASIWSKYLSNKNKLDLVITSSELYSFYSAIFSATYNFKKERENKYEIMKFFIMSSNSQVLEDYKDAIIWNRIALNRIMNCPLKEYSEPYFYNAIYNIQNCNIELRDNSEYDSWNEIVYNNNSNIEIPLPSDPRKLTKKEVDDCFDYYTKNIIVKNLDNLDEEEVKDHSSFLKKTANIYAKDKKWERAYSLMLKKDSLEIKIIDSHDYFFQLGYLGNEGFNLPKVNLLNSKNKYLLEVNDYLRELKEELDSQIYNLNIVKNNIDEQIIDRKNELIKANDSIGTILFLNEELKMQSEELAFKNREIEEAQAKLNNTAIGLLVLAFLSLFFFFLAKRRQREAEAARAEAEEAKVKAEMDAQTIYQLGHLGPRTIGTLLGRLRGLELPENVFESVKTRLEKIQSLLQGLYEHYIADSINLDKEFDLSSKYAEIELYNDGHIYNSGENIIKGNFNEFRHINFPRFVLLNSVQNALKHGGFKQNFNLAKITVTIIEKEFFYEFKIVNPMLYINKGFENKNGTGHKFMQKILEYWNKGLVEDSIYTKETDTEYQVKFLIKKK